MGRGEQRGGRAVKHAPCRRTAAQPPAHRLPLCCADKLGTGFGLVKHDVGGNIDRLASCAATKPEVYQADAFQMVRDDVAAGTHTGSSSVTKGLLWLKRCGAQAGRDSVCWYRASLQHHRPHLLVLPRVAIKQNVRVSLPAAVLRRIGPWSSLWHCWTSCTATVPCRSAPQPARRTTPRCSATTAGS